MVFVLLGLQVLSIGKSCEVLKGLGHADPTRIDTVRTIHEISRGMAYLHGQGVLHGGPRYRFQPSKRPSREINNASTGCKRTCQGGTQVASSATLVKAR